VYSFCRFLYKFSVESNKCSRSRTAGNNQAAGFSMLIGLPISRLTFQFSSV
jgi:hypothetical protein